MAQAFVFPSVIGIADDYKFSDGVLFKLNPELGGANKLKSYAQINKAGWHKIDFNYSMYVHRSDEFGVLRFVGLLPDGAKPSRGNQVACPFSKKEIEKYVEGLVEIERQSRSSITDEIALLIHDLRRFSNSIYQNAVATKKAIFDGDSEEAEVRIENTLAAQAMLRIRTDILDLAESRGTALDEESVAVYRKFDKVVKSFQPGCSLRNIDLKISGTSHSLTKGPDCVEIIAYILVDNALKYSPNNHNINVIVEEEARFITVSVTSLGPIISNSELETIFEKGFRGASARLLDVSGTGYGLFMAKSLISRFSGVIECEQFGETTTTNRGTFRDTTFRARFPIFETRVAPVHQHQERKSPPKQLAPRSKRVPADSMSGGLQKNSASENGVTASKGVRKKRRNRKKYNPTKVLEKIS